MNHLGTVLLLISPLLLAPAFAADDPLSALPERWQRHMSALPPIDRSNLDTATTRRLDELRHQIGKILADGETRTLIEPMSELCAVYQAIGTRRSAETCYQNLRRLDPDEFRWAYQYAWMALRSGRDDDALNLLDEAAKLRSDYPPLTLRRGEALYGLNRLVEAETAFRSALHEPGLRARSQYFLGQIALLAHDYEQARDHFQDALSLAPEAAAIHYPLAQALRALGDNEAARAQLALKGTGLPNATDQFAESVATAASGAKAHFHAGMKALEANDPEQAVSEFETGLTLDPENRAARISYARMLFLSGHESESRVQLQHILASGHPVPLAAFLLGVLHDAKGDDALATDLYRRALQIDPDMAGAHHFLGQLLYRSGDYRAASPHLKYAADADQNNFPAQLLSWVARYRVGEAPDTLIAELSAIHESAPGNPMLGYALVRLLSVHGKPERALALARALVDKAAFAPLQAALGAALAANAQPQEAARALTIAHDAAAKSGQTRWAAHLDQERKRALQGLLPEFAWPADDPLFEGQKADPVRPFRDYPAGAAY
ncbi:MAG: tetratricopeptide repeat protein [Gammaproteobacteria bacterium]|nr:tetratricopeptide repeat protein [Gammaproteobacteria bacterium]MCP5135508.1 tetratricopeptide repeat protein [Gammaproteobacteria bacterium]